MSSEDLRNLFYNEAADKPFFCCMYVTMKLLTTRKPLFTHISFTSLNSTLWKQSLFISF